MRRSTELLYFVMERKDLRRWRRRFLWDLQRVVEEGKMLIWTDETWLDSNMRPTRCWVDLTVERNPDLATRVGCDLCLGPKVQYPQATVLFHRKYHIFR